MSPRFLGFFPALAKVLDLQFHRPQPEELRHNWAEDGPRRKVATPYLTSWMNSKYTLRVLLRRLLSLQVFRKQLIAMYQPRRLRPVASIRQHLFCPCVLA